MIDMTKVVFEEVDDDEYPTEIYYGYTIDSNQIREFIKDETSEPSSENEKFSMDGELIARFVLTVFCEGDYKLELLVEDESGRQNWYIVCFQFYNTPHEWFELIPNYGKLRFRVPVEVGV